MDKISVERSLRWTQGFLAAEWQLALPIALAFIGLPTLVSNLMMTRLMASRPETVAEMQSLVAALPWWVSPAAIALTLVMLTGGLALIALALLPQVSVAEAIQSAMRRLPTTIAAALLLWAGMLLVLLLIGIAAAVLHLPQGLILLLTILLVVGVWLYMLLLLPLLVDRRTGSIAAFRASRRFYQGIAWKLAAALILYLAVTFVMTLAIQVAVGSAIMAAANLAGSPETGRVLAAILSSTLTAAQIGGLFLLVAAFYRQRVGRG